MRKKGKRKENEIISCKFLAVKIQNLVPLAAEVE